METVDPKVGITNSQVRAAIEVLYGADDVDRVLAHNNVMVGPDWTVHVTPKGKWEK